MKQLNILIIRTHPTEINLDSYNVQEIGLADSLMTYGHNVEVVLFTDSLSRVENHKTRCGNVIKIHWIKGKNILWQGIFDMSELEQLASHFDVIQLNEYSQVASYYISKRSKKPCVIYHGPYRNMFDWKANLLNMIFDFLFLRNMRKLPITIATKSEAASEFLRKKGFHDVHTVGVGLDLSRFDLSLNTNVQTKQGEILYIGEISRRRNTLFLLQVFNRLLEMHYDVHLTMIGKSPDNKADLKYFSGCMNYIKQHDLGNNIKLIDRLPQTELPKYYQEANVFLFPSRYEIFGMVLMEAMLFKVPIVSSVNGGSDTLIRNNFNGVLHEQFDIDCWCNSVIEIIENNDFSSKISENGYKTVVNNFTWNSISKKMLSLYEKQYENLKDF